MTAPMFGQDRVCRHCRGTGHPKGHEGRACAACGGTGIDRKAKEARRWA